MDSCDYADRPPAGYELLDDETPAAEGDVAYIGNIGGQWVRVRPRQNIIGATLDELWGSSSVIALARQVKANPTT